MARAATPAKKADEDQMTSTDPFAEFQAVDPSEVFATGGTQRERLDPIVAKRKKMIEGIETQIKMFEDPNWMMERTIYRQVEGEDRRKGYTEKYRPRTQWKETRDGKFLVEPRYGVRKFIVAPGKEAFLLTREQVVPFFNKVIDVVQNGSHDKQLEELSKRDGKKG